MNRSECQGGCPCIDLRSKDKIGIVRCLRSFVVETMFALFALFASPSPIALTFFLSVLLLPQHYLGKHNISCNSETYHYYLGRGPALLLTIKVLYTSDQAPTSTDRQMPNPFCVSYSPTAFSTRRQISFHSTSTRTVPLLNGFLLGALLGRPSCVARQPNF